MSLLILLDPAGFVHAGTFFILFFFIDQAKLHIAMQNTVTGQRLKKYTEIERAAGFKAPSAILCSNEEVSGKLECDVSSLSQSTRSCCPKYDKAKERSCQRTTDADISTKLVSGFKSTCKNMQFFSKPHKKVSTFIERRTPPHPTPTCLLIQ